MIRPNQPTRNTRVVARIIDPAQIAKPTKARIGKMERNAKVVQNSYDKRVRRSAW
jgi:hypothetical protein